MGGRPRYRFSAGCEKAGASWKGFPPHVGSGLSGVAMLYIFPPLSTFLSKGLAAPAERHLNDVPVKRCYHDTHDNGVPESRDTAIVIWPPCCQSCQAGPRSSHSPSGWPVAVILSSLYRINEAAIEHTHPVLTRLCQCPRVKCLILSVGAYGQASLCSLCARCLEVSLSSLCSGDTPGHMATGNTQGHGARNGHHSRVGRRSGAEAA